MEYVENICRICLTGGATDIDKLLIDIFQPLPLELFTETDFSIQNALRLICGLEVSEDDRYPKQLCSVCHSRLEEAYKLRQQSQKSQETLFNILSKASASELYTEEVDEDKMYDVEYLEETELLQTAVEDDVKPEEFVLENVIENPTAHDQNQHEIVDENVDCCGCYASYQTELELRKHSIRCHRPKKSVTIGEGAIQCNICYALFTNEYKLSVHKFGKNNVQPLIKCEFCGCNFHTSTGLTKHKRAFHPKKLFICCGCNFYAQEKSDLIAHSNCHKPVSAASAIEKRAKKFRCTICWSRFQTLNEKLLHERFPYRKQRFRQKVEDKLITSVTRCCGCPKVFINITELREHQAEVHLPQRNHDFDHKLLIECDGCYKRFKSKAFFNKHLRRAADKKLYACSKCSVTRRTLKDLMEHEATHTGGGAFICCGCRKGFESQQALEKHSLEEHANRPKVYYKDEEDTERPFACKICYRRYKSARDLRGHQRFVYYEKIHVCDICGKGFAQENNLAVHLATHKAFPEFPCPICGKKYKHQSNVRNCVTRHERPKQHKCKICNVTFPAASNLYSHMISHSDDRRYKCDICDQSFKRSFHLRKHKNTHSSERNYQCKYCSATFCSTTEQYKHEIRHTGLYPYQCDICHKKLTTRQVFIKHYEGHMDDSDKLFKCHLCPVRYSQDHFLSNHIKYKHKIEPQDKSWNDKFNRQGPYRLKGGVRMAGIIGNYALDVCDIIEADGNEFGEPYEIITEELEVQDEEI